MARRRSGHAFCFRTLRPQPNWFCWGSQRLERCVHASTLCSVRARLRSDRTRRQFARSKAPATRWRTALKPGGLARARLSLIHI
eukprot:2909661-Alexandrium_andersonii.AAC.1